MVTVMTIEPATTERTPLDRSLTERGLALVNGKTTDMADAVLRVPLHYYRDEKITEVEESSILRRTPLAIVPSSQIPHSHDYVVRSVLGDSLLVTRDGDGRAHVFLNYCRHRPSVRPTRSRNAPRWVARPNRRHRDPHL